MLNRVFKTIFILTLSLCITLSTNAGNVEVSDGSAFITKSELSYQLNNLSARMSALENSLDSQIDKLVSSYLTRNGIWNGVKQTINTTSFSFWPADVSLSGGNGSYNGNLVTGTYINRINKAGMLVFSYKYRNYSGTNNNNTRWGYYVGVKSGAWYSDSGYVLNLNVYEKDELEFSTVLLSSICTNSALTGGSMYASLPASFVNANVVIFVEKGSAITYAIYEAVHCQNVNSISPTKNEHTKFYMIFNDDAKVY